MDGIDLTIPGGTVFGLLGPNGAGQTTIVSILATLIEPDDGQAAVLGYDVTAHGHQVRQLIGLTGQYAALGETLSGTENLVLIGRLTGASRKDARERASELLARFRLADAAGRAVKTYSGGMRGRLDLAASLVSRPRVLFLDEPTTGLDPRSRNELWDIVRDLVAEGVTVLLTTQYLTTSRRSARERHNPDPGPGRPAARPRPPAAGRPADLLARLADAGAGQAQPVRADGLLHPADHVPAPVRVRVRRRDQRLLARLPAVRAGGHARFAPLAGRIIADIAKQAWAIALLFAAGPIMGFRAGTNPLAVLAAGGLVLLCTLAFAWALVWIGMLAANPEQVQIFGFVVRTSATVMRHAFGKACCTPSAFGRFSEARVIRARS